MESGPALILRTLDRHLTGPGEVRLFGGAAFVLRYGRDRTTAELFAAAKPKVFALMKR